MLAILPKGEPVKRRTDDREISVLLAGGGLQPTAFQPRRLQLPTRLVDFTEALSRTQSNHEVYRVCADHLAGIVGGYGCILFVAPTGEKDPQWLEPLDHSLIHLTGRDCSIPAALRHAGSTLIRITDTEPNIGGPYSRLAHLFMECDIVALACVPFGDAGVFMIAERRIDCVFSADDWDLMRALARQVAFALDRIRLFEQVRDLSLTDPLTGLANRRRLDVVLELGFAAARRGEPLTLIMVDLDEFKQINDRSGHLHGDSMLKLFAHTLREQVRDSDLAARFGGDEFMVVLHGPAEGAALLLGRVAKALQGSISFSAGVAQFDSTFASPEALIQAADRDLYLKKKQVSNLVDAF